VPLSFDEKQQLRRVANRTGADMVLGSRGNASPRCRYRATTVTGALEEALIRICNLESGRPLDHGTLQGLGDDDHPQYLTEAEHDGLGHLFLSCLTSQSEPLDNPRTQLCFSNDADGTHLDVTPDTRVIGDLIIEADKGFGIQNSTYFTAPLIEAKRQDGEAAGVFQSKTIGSNLGNATMIELLYTNSRTSGLLIGGVACLDGEINQEVDNAAGGNWLGSLRGFDIQILASATAAGAVGPFTGSAMTFVSETDANISLSPRPVLDIAATANHTTSGVWGIGAPAMDFVVTAKGTGTNVAGQMRAIATSAAAAATDVNYGFKFSSQGNTTYQGILVGGWGETDTPGTAAPGVIGLLGTAQSISSPGSNGIHVGVKAYNGSLFASNSELIVSGETGSAAALPTSLSNTPGHWTLDDRNGDGYFEGDLEVDGSFFADADVHWKSVSPAEITSDTDDYAGAAGFSVARLTTDASRMLGGFTDGEEGKHLLIINVGSNALVIEDTATAGGTATNHVITGTGGNVTLAANDTIQLWYDGTTTKWRAV